MPTFGDPAGVAHQAFGLFVTVDAHQQPPAQRRRFLAALAVAVVEVGVDPRGGGLHRQFTQRGEVGLREERIDRRPRLFRHVDLALAQALQQLARRQVDEDDLVGLLQHQSGTVSRTCTPVMSRTWSLRLSRCWTLTVV